MEKTLLGNSTTFLGCLFTLVVLCFFIDKNNFIFGLIRSILKESIDESDEVLKDHDNMITKTYNSANEIQKTFSELAKDDHDLHQEGLTLLNNTELLVMTSRTISISMKDLQNTYNGIKKGDEFVSSFLYSFLFCIVIFVCDEFFVGSVSSVSNFCLNLVFVFSIITLFLWIAKWFYFLFHINKRDASICYKYNFGYILTFGLILGIPLISVLISYLFSKYLELDFSFIILFYLIIVVGVGTFAMVKFWKNKFRFTSYFVLSHFFCILISIIVMLFIAGFVYKDAIVGAIQVRRLALCTTLLIGFIFPLFIPLLKMRFNIRTINKKAEVEIKRFRARLDTVNSEQNSYMQKVGNYLRNKK